MPFTKDQIREKLPWIREIEALNGKEIQESCPDCACGLGKPHNPNCDVPRNTKTGEQRLTSETEEDFQEVWVGACIHTPTKSPSEKISSAEPSSNKTEQHP